MRLTVFAASAKFIKNNIAFCVLSAICLMSLCCQTIAPGEQHYRMGELASVGPVIYNVLETDWRTEIGQSLEQKIPEHKFLLIQLTITNSGNQDVAIPLLSLEDQQDNSYLEVSEVEGVANWLGLLRILDPASTMQGTIVFDVPTGDYNLRVTDGGELDNERTALVEIPLSLGTPASVEPLEALESELE